MFQVVRTGSSQYASPVAGSSDTTATPLALSRQVLASTRPVWETTGAPDAVRMTREALATLDALDTALSTNVVDAEAVTAAVEDVTRACNACHASYREGDETTGYRMKPGPR